MDQYAKLRQQIYDESNRYLHDYTLIDVERYGVGGGLMKMILGLAAMHAMSGLLSDGGGGSARPRPKPAQQTSPSNQDFEKLHPRAKVQIGNSKPGQFAKKPGAGSQANTSPPQVRPLTERPDKPMQTTPQQPSPPDAPVVQPPSDSNTARIAEIWKVNSQQPTSEIPDGAVTPMTAPTLESFTAEVMKNMASGLDPSIEAAKTAPNPRKRFTDDFWLTPNPGFKPQEELWTNPDKTAGKSLLDIPAQSDSGDIFANPAAKARKEKAELDRITAFDPASFAEKPLADERVFEVRQPTEDDFDTPEQLEKMKSWRASRPEDETDVSSMESWRAKKPETFESAIKKWKNKLYRHNSAVNAAMIEDPETNTAEIAAEYDLELEEFGKYAAELEQFEQGEWKRREAVKTAIRKVWGVDSADLSRMENRKGIDHSSLAGADALKGNLEDDQIYEFLGSDEGNWAQNAWDMLREDAPPKPGRHDKEWLRKHAEYFSQTEQMSNPDGGYPKSDDESDNSAGEVMVFGEPVKLRTKKTVSRMGDFDRHTIEIGGEGRESLGKIEVSHNKQSGTMEVRAIDANLRSQGIGTRLYGAAIEQAKSIGVSTFGSDSRISESAYKSWTALREKLGDDVVTESPSTNSGSQRSADGPVFSIDLSRVSPEAARSLRIHGLRDQQSPRTQRPGTGYPEPEDGMPFSRRSLTRQMDRYFRSRMTQKQPGFWTLMDQWL